MADIDFLSKEFQLPCGATLTNRLAKSAMSENMANKDNSPSKKLITLYRRWSVGGAGLLVTGNIMVDSKALGEPANVVVEDERNLAFLKQMASATKGTGTHLWTQLNHPGRQAPFNLNKETVAPSAIASKANKFMFRQPRALREDEIWAIIERFGNSALILKKAGFTGVQIHGAHGYLVAQFLSPLSNVRTDQWGGSLENRARFAVEIYKRIREKVGNDYPVGIKINSADFQRGGFSEEESMAVIDILSSLGIDLVEISGGNYEQPAMMGAKQSSKEREAYFMDYIEKVRKRTTIPLMLTGGFRTVKLMNDAIKDGHLDIVGLARPFTLYPELARDILNGSINKLEVPVAKTGIKMIDKLGFIDLLWHELQLERIGAGKEPDQNLSPYLTMVRMAQQNLFR
ncbi:MAG: NADH:flavin oxidoreductase/NADH oxidase family protein [Chitinophagales bacterium]